MALRLVVSGLLLAAWGAAPLAAAEADQQPGFHYPQQRAVDGHTVVIHAPQIRTWPQFKSFEGLVALELHPADKSAVRLATASISGSTEVELDSRMVVVRNPRVDKVQFTGAAVPASYTQAIQDLATRDQLDVPLDLFLAALADDVLDTSAPPGFNVTPPPIHVSHAPTILLFVNGVPALQAVEGTPMQVLVNANWPTFQVGGQYYLLAGERWLTAARLEGPWAPTTTLPTEFNSIPANGPHAAIKSAVPPKSTQQPAPTVLPSKTPAELIVIDGANKLVAIPNATGLSYVSNTASPLFSYQGKWYFLASGRWFSTENLEQGPWGFVTALPEVFKSIPVDHAMAQVRASVPGTTEARMAVLEARLPTTKSVATNAQPPVQVTYAGAPQFEPIASTQVSRAANSTFDVLSYGGKFYWCYAGIWYLGASANGPWTVATSIPAAIYSIPPSSPSYPVTQVVVQQSSPTTVEYSYPPGYAANVFVAYGVVVYGTGWYYPPYWGAGFYYPYMGSYGHGSWYNPNTGNYGSRSVYYGPYGGYSYNQAYNPRTGRYGEAETAWDGDEWASYGNTWNPRTGVSTETSRYYNEDSNRMSMDRTTQRGDQSITTNRETDFDNRTQTVNREGSGGGSQSVTRSVEDGRINSAGTLNTADGQTINTNTQREGRTSVTTAEGSGGGQMASVSQGIGRTSIAQSGSGDLYAGHDGNVYKKTDDGWSHYQGGSWNSVNMPEHSQSRQLDRDYSARQAGGQQFNRRAGGVRMGGGMRRR